MLNEEEARIPRKYWVAQLAQQKNENALGARHRMVTVIVGLFCFPRQLLKHPLWPRVVLVALVRLLPVQW